MTKTTGKTSLRGGQAQSAFLPKAYTPKAIKEYLDRHVIGQDEAKKVLSIAVYNHYKRLIAKESSVPGCRIDKSNVLLLGNTGCGKTHIVKTIARMLGVPCYIQDCTKLTAAGYVGSDVEECITGLLRECDYDIQKAQRGIVMLDEIDKIAAKGSGPSIVRDVSGECVQQSLLKMVEGDTVGVMPQGGRKHPEVPLLYVNTSEILFIASGAFVGIEDIIGRRIGTGLRKIGFAGAEKPVETADKSVVRFTSPEDLRDFGMIPEFVGRFPVVTYVNPLGEQDLVRILTEPEDSLVRQYRTLLEMDGWQVDFEDGALEMIARHAMALGTGARGLRCMMELVMRDIMFDAPSSSSRRRSTKISADYVKERLGSVVRIKDAV